MPLKEPVCSCGNTSLQLVDGDEWAVVRFTLERPPMLIERIPVSPLLCLDCGQVLLRGHVDTDPEGREYLALKDG